MKKPRVLRPGFGLARDSGDLRPWVLLLCAACACNSATETGNPHDPQPGGNPIDPGGTPSGCRTEDLEPTEPTSIGMTAGEFLDLISGEHRQSLRWLGGDEAFGGTFGPETGTAEITFTVEAVDDVRYVRQGPTTAVDAISTCDDYIEVGVRIHVASSGGALDEVVNTTVRASSGDLAEAVISIDADSLTGSFEAELEPGENRELRRKELDVALAFSEHGVVGDVDLVAYYSLPSDSVVMTSGGKVAHFPAENYCGPRAVSLTADQNVRGLSMEAVLDALNEISPATLTYDGGGGAELELSFAAAESRFCAGLDPTPLVEPLMQFAGSVSLLSSDGRIDGDIPLEVTMMTEGNDETQILASARYYTEDPDEAITLPAEVGIQDPIDASGYDGLQIAFQSRVVSEFADGFLRVRGFTDCPESPPDPDGMSIPGCDAASIPLWGAIWVPTE